MLAKVEGEPGLVRSESGAIHNTNNNEYQAYISKRNEILANRKRLEAIEADNIEIKSTLNQILELLMKDKK